jgi:predicted RNA-binding Zn ribbon-like protein
MEVTVRRGGIQTLEGFLFELSGGDVALDFVNTVDMRPTDHGKELICTYADLCSWARQAGLLTRREEQDLLKKGRRDPKTSEATRRFAIDLRECMFRIFKSVSDEEDVLENVLQKWNAFVRRMMQHYVLVRSQEGFSWKEYPKELNFDSMLWPAIHSAVQLLTGPNARRIRRCASEKCDWLFLDTSKRGNRRWCDMTVCGNRAKAQRFYSRKKVQKTTIEP